jgi:uncharacterized protein (DUF1015 family)
MNLVRPFRALRPPREFAAAVIAPPYDVVDTSEARALAERQTHSFLHVSRPEIDFPDGTDSHADAVYAKATENFDALVAKKILLRDAEPMYYVYRMATDGRSQTGVAMTASVRAYDANRVRRHELTRPDKEQDRVRHIEAVNAQTGPVLCAFRTNSELRRLISAASLESPDVSTAGPHGVTHSVWPITDGELATELDRQLNALDAIYIADGHHRSAAASRVAATRRAMTNDPNASHEFFLTVAFPHDEMQIFDYNRAVTDLNGLTSAELLERIGKRFSIQRVDRPHRPRARREFGMFLDGNWYVLATAASSQRLDPVGSLDVSILQDLIIGPILGIENQRTDPRIEFVGGIRGLAELERRVSSGKAAVAFSVFPTSMEQLMAVADAELLMPPKSTWFEPKLADGLLSHVLD